MKNLGKGLLLVAVLAFALTSCNKEKAAVKKLDGTWTLKSSSVENGGEDCSSGGGTEPTVTYEFTSYSVGDEESGDLKVTVDTSTVDYTYSVNEDATELTLTLEILGTTTNTTWTIESLSKSSAELSLTQNQTVITDCSTFATEDRDVTTTITLEK